MRRARQTVIFNSNPLSRYSFFGGGQRVRSVIVPGVGKKAQIYVKVNPPGANMDSPTPAQLRAPRARTPTLTAPTDTTHIVGGGPPAWFDQLFT